MLCYITILNMFRAVPCSSSGGTNYIVTASGIVTLCKQPYSMPVESGLQTALNRHTVQLFTESDDTRGCNNIICSSWRWARYRSKHVENRNV